MSSVTQLAVLLCSLLAVTISAQPKGLRLTLERETLYGLENEKVCGRLTCKARGDSVVMRSARIYRIKVAHVTSDTNTTVLSISADSLSENEVASEGVHGNGTLENGDATIYLDLRDTASCRTDLFTCTVEFTNPAGERDTAFAMSGPGDNPAPCQDKTSRGTGPATRPPSTESEIKTSVQHAERGNPYASELWFLSEKLTRVEEKFETLSGRLDGRLSLTMEATQKRAATLESTVLGRMVTVETDFSSRVSRLEDRLSTFLLSESQSDTHDKSSPLRAVERRLDDLWTAVEELNVTLKSSIKVDAGREKEIKEFVCEPGMGNDLRSSYPPYVKVKDSLLQRDVLCDTHTDGGGWIVIQRRAQGDVNFYRDWESYKDGFGSPLGDHWLGNEAIHKLTDQHPYTLRIDMRIDGQEVFAAYSSFRLENEADKYRLRLGAYTGTAGETSSKGLSYHNNAAFSTFDRDSDDVSANCATDYHGAWWYRACHTSNLNGPWGVKSEKGVNWDSGTDRYPSFTEMKIRRVTSDGSR